MRAILVGIWLLAILEVSAHAQPQQSPETQALIAKMMQEINGGVPL